MLRRSFLKICTLCILASLIILWAQPAFALSPEDILVVYNRNMFGSRAVAEHYVEKRGVPAGNILGLELSDFEIISRTKFETALFPQVREAVIKLQQAGRKPVILLVYGVPLRVGECKSEGKAKQERLVKRKIEELGALIAKLTGDLHKLTAGNEQAKDVSGSDVPGILQGVQKALTQAGEFQMKARFLPKPPQPILEIESIAFRLVGLSPIARGIKKRAEWKGYGFEAIFKNDSLLRGSAVIETQLAKVPFRGVTRENMQDVASMLRVSRGLVGELSFWYGLQGVGDSDETSASVDSELSLILAEPYLKARWLPNPFLSQFDNIPGIEQIRDNTIKVARLDGPTPELAKRLVNDAVLTEYIGLRFYIDARGRTAKKKDDYYGRYDEQLRKLYEIVKEKSSMPVVLDNKSGVFPEGACPDAALYCGWYSLAEYVDAFKWKRGAVGFHIASSEAKTLRKPGSQVWCKRMIEEGVAATLGPVQEPYLQSFPRPDIFFPLLMSGKLPLIEVYYRSTPFLSWRQVLIGDPLYTPFKTQPAIDAK